MKKLKYVLSILICLSMCLSLCACGDKPKPEDDLPAISDEGRSPKDSSDLQSTPSTVDMVTVEGWIGEEIKLPDWVSEHLRKTDVQGNTMYIAVMTKDGIPAAAAYDTINNSWQRWNISCDGIDNPVFRNFSVVGDNLYAILMSNTCQEYYISHLNLSSGDSKCAKITYWKDGLNFFPNAVIALDNETCLLNDGQNTYVLDTGA